MVRERKFTQDLLFKTTKHLLLENGYEGFTFTLLAEQLQVSRATLYKYFQNKDELITAYMIFEMKEFLSEIRKIDSYSTFDAQFDFLLATIYHHKNTHEIVGMAHIIPTNSNQKIKANKLELEQLHLQMYKRLQNFIRVGIEEKRLKEGLSSHLILGFIFQSIAIPYRGELSHQEWMNQIKTMISHGILTSNN